MFRDNDDDGPGMDEVIDDVQARRGRTQDRDCDFCGTSEGSVIVDRELSHPDVRGSPPVCWCRDCFNDPETHPSDE